MRGHEGQNRRWLSLGALSKQMMNPLLTITEGCLKVKKESLILYKFRKIDKRLIESLVNQNLYFANPTSLNDPFDCQIDLEAALKRAELSATTTERTSSRHF